MQVLACALITPQLQNIWILVFSNFSKYNTQIDFKCVNSKYILPVLYYNKSSGPPSEYWFQHDAERANYSVTQALPLSWPLTCEWTEEEPAAFSRGLSPSGLRMWQETDREEKERQRVREQKGPQKRNRHMRVRQRREKETQRERETWDRGNESKNDWQTDRRFVTGKEWRLWPQRDLARKLTDSNLSFHSAPRLTASSYPVTAA